MLCCRKRKENNLPPGIILNHSQYIKGFIWYSNGIVMNFMKLYLKTVAHRLLFCTFFPLKHF